ARRGTRLTVAVLVAIVRTRCHDRATRAQPEPEDGCGEDRNHDLLSERKRPENAREDLLDLLQPVRKRDPERSNESRNESVGAHVVEERSPDAFGPARRRAEENPSRDETDEGGAERYRGPLPSSSSRDEDEECENEDERRSGDSMARGSDERH